MCKILKQNGQFYHRMIDRLVSYETGAMPEEEQQELRTWFQEDYGSVLKFVDVCLEILIKSMEEDGVSPEDAGIIRKIVSCPYVPQSRKQVFRELAQA